MNLWSPFWKMQKITNKNCKIVVNPQYLPLQLHFTQNARRRALKKKLFLLPGEAILLFLMTTHRPATQIFIFSKMILTKLKITLLLGKEIWMISEYLILKLTLNHFWKVGFIILRAQWMQKWISKSQRCWKTSKEIKDGPRKETNSRINFYFWPIFFPFPYIMHAEYILKMIEMTLPTVQCM